MNQYSLSGSITPTYDGRGNLTAAGGPAHIYTSDNLLSGVNGVGSLAYDPLRRLIGVEAATRFGYDGTDMIGEYSSSNSLTRRGACPGLRAGVHGPGADEPLVWYEGSGTTDRRWLHADERGSVIAVTNVSGAATILNSYDEYGIPGAANAGRFQYTGQAWLPELGLYHYKARTYSPTLGRFLQTDPIGYGEGMNLYAYVANDPVNGTDPSGTVRTIRVCREVASGGGEGMDITSIITTFCEQVELLEDVNQQNDNENAKTNTTNTPNIPEKSMPKRPNYCNNSKYKAAKFADMIGKATTSLGAAGSLIPFPTIQAASKFAIFGGTFLSFGSASYIMTQFPDAGRNTSLGASMTAGILLDRAGVNSAGSFVSGQIFDFALDNSWSDPCQ